MACGEERTRVRGGLDVKPADLLLVVAAVALASAVACVSVPVGLATGSLAFVGLWWLLDDEVGL